jgi:hypothetical protein
MKLRVSGRFSALYRPAYFGWQTCIGGPFYFSHHALVSAVAVSVVAFVNEIQAWIDAGAFLSICFVCE